MDEFQVCPHCGAEIGVEAKFCRQCGSSDADGWSEASGGADVDEFDYDEYVAENFPVSPLTTSTKPIWRIVAIALLGLFLLGYLLF